MAPLQPNNRPMAAAAALHNEPIGGAATLQLRSAQRALNQDDIAM